MAHPHSFARWQHQVASSVCLTLKIGVAIDVNHFSRILIAALNFALLFSVAKKRAVAATECAFFLVIRQPSSRPEPFVLGAADFSLVNPNTGTAPIFRTKRDAELATAIYRRLPVLVDRSNGAENKAWPLRYMTMFHMTNDSHLFWTRERLEKEGAYPSGLGRWHKGELEWLPLYEGKMVQAFDHRAADIVVNIENVHRPAQPEIIDDLAHVNSNRLATPQYWVQKSDVANFELAPIVIGFKDVTSPTNERGMIAAFLPEAGSAILFQSYTLIIARRFDTRELWLGMLNSLVFDLCARQKVQGQHLNWFIVEQLPCVPANITACASERLRRGNREGRRASPHLYRQRHGAVRA